MSFKSQNKAFKKNYSFFIFVVCCFTLPVISQASPSFQFERNLSVGDSGPDVKELQILLNTDPDTKVASFGFGSKGQETNFFGQLTKIAIIKFQNKYKDRILTPIGLSFGTGFFGEKTRLHANALLFGSDEASYYFNNNLENNDVSVQNTPPNSLLENQMVVPIETKSINKNIGKPENLFGAGGENDYLFDNQNSAQNNINNNQGSVDQSVLLSEYKNSPNFDNFDEFLNLVEETGRSQGYGQAELARVKEVLVQNSLASSTNFLLEFERQMRVSGSVSNETVKNPLMNYMAKIFNNLKEGVIKSASAISGLPFGAMVLFPTICTCSGNWLVAMVPLSPGAPALITHYTGAQMYLNMNFPFSRYVLGYYIPGGAPCMMVAGPMCITIPSMGMTTPQIGSI